jgi:hypothetical protein
MSEFLISLSRILRGPDDPKVGHDRIFSVTSLAGYAFKAVDLIKQFVSMFDSSLKLNNSGF